MRPNFWQKIVSYLGEWVIERVESRFSGKLTLGVWKGRYVLSSANAVYSHEDLYYNFRAVFAQIKLGFENMLVLGAGLGSVPLILEKIHKQKSTYTLVEIDPIIVNLCQKYALPNLLSPCELLQADAAVFVQNCNQKFDCIVIDIFIDAQTPNQFASIEFLQAAKACLTPNGVLLFNQFATNEAQERSNTEYFQAIFQPVFAQASVCKIANNNILCSHFYPF